MGDTWVVLRKGSRRRKARGTDALGDRARTDVDLWPRANRALLPFTSQVTPVKLHGCLPHVERNEILWDVSSNGVYKSLTRRRRDS